MFFHDSIEFVKRFRSPTCIGLMYLVAWSIEPHHSVLSGEEKGLTPSLRVMQYVEDINLL